MTPAEKLPPSNADAEQATLGALLLDRDAITKVSGWLQPNDFFRECHRWVYEAMLALYRRNEPADIVTVTDELERLEQLKAAGGVAYIHSLATVVPTAIHVEHYGRIVQRTALKRRLISVAGSIASMGYDDALEVDDTLDQALGLVADLSKSAHSDSGIFEVLDISEDIDALYDAGPVPGESVGWTGLDPYYQVRRGEMTITTGMPSAGKSEWQDAVVVNLARGAEWRFAICSPENQPISEHATRLISKLVDKPFDDGPHPRLDRQELVRAKAWLHDHMVWLMPDDGHLTVSNVLNLAATAHAKRPIDGLVIDPWNELDHQRPGNMSETDYISASLTKIRRFARRFGIHVWLTAHPTKLQQREDGSYPVPTLYSISGSAHWRNKADNGIVVHRDLSHPEDPTVQIHVQKIRFRKYGRIGCVELTWDHVTGNYYDLRGRN